LSNLKKVISQIKKYNNFLIVSHINPEGDSLGSQLGFAFLLKAMGKKCNIVNTQSPPDFYKFLPNINTIQTTIKKQVKYDIVCFLDCADESRIGEIAAKIDLTKPKLNIDHHPSNTGFGDINVVLTQSSSAAEIVYKLFKESGIKISKNIATCLYAGILTDTGSFSYSNVSAYTHQVAAELIETGLDINYIYRKAYEEVKLSTLRLLGSALSTLSISNNGRVAWMQVTRVMFRKNKSCIEHEKEFISFPRSIKGVEVAVLFTEVTKNKTKVNFRSNTKANVNKIASHFGGGGHQKASGCLINEPIKVAKKKVLAEIKKHLKHEK